MRANSRVVPMHDGLKRQAFSRVKIRKRQAGHAGGAWERWSLEGLVAR